MATARTPKLAAAERFVVMVGKEDGARQEAKQGETDAASLVLWDWDSGRIRSLRVPATADVAPAHFLHAFVLREGVEGRCEAIAGLYMDPASNVAKWHVWREPEAGHFTYCDKDFHDERLIQFAQLVASNATAPESTPSQIPPNLVDICWVSAWLAVGATSFDVVWVKNGSIMCHFDPWPPDEDGPRVDPVSGNKETLICIAANAEFVCIATSFGRLHVLCRQDMAWRLTLPLGELIVSMAATRWRGQLVATRTADGSIRIPPPGGNHVALLLNNFVIATSNVSPNELLIFALTPHKAAKVGRLLLSAACIGFDIDVHKRNRIVALDVAGTLSIFPLRLGDQFEPAVRIKFRDEPKPVLVAAHAGRIAVANHSTLVVLLRPGQSAEEFRIDKTFRHLRISSLHWHGPNSVVLNHVEHFSRSRRSAVATMLFYTVFKTLEGKPVTVEMKNGVEVQGELHSVDQYLNVKLINVSPVDEAKYPQLAVLKTCFIRGSVVRYISLRKQDMDIPLLQDAARRELSKDSTAP
ncbi:U6 snRNA-associated Sm-like protein LSm2 [Hondaea fermentalgiana]|uniref:U6 snRNA-associated Sm-like protein LSm2 n=1 Tax=Hondaea fermentalgiana TaxID=2315210 RepID=A0A2R5GC17_9STRA|nr:U6 snRNA-associated Sm-like protein LSm2 [Hondaea fermentalgiana]|eukprot:GBG25671.1 U6 snRNA-associated Sm-like protein LSm2 [Hondaea fermentalgiana]